MEDEQFEELLANYDEALAQGATPVNSTSPKDAALRERLAEAQACLDLLESAFPRHPPSTLDARLGQTAFSTLYTQPLTIGRFDIRRELGRGGHGVVFLAYDTALKREVALKVPRPDILQSVDMRSRFRREAEAAARLQHPNLIPLYEAGEIGPVCYLVSEFCPGPNLATWLSRHAAPIAPKSVIRLVAALADAVGYMHQQGVLHRDIKPGNIILQFPVALPPELANPQDNYPDADFAIPRITDFGLAHFVEDVAIHTSTGIIVGTPGHMAPEQIEGKRDEVGPPADVYALGVIIYLLLTRRLPVEGATDFETLKRISTDDPVSLRRLRREVPRDLETVVLKCLEKRPARRYPAASDLADDLRRVLAGEAIQARRASSLERLRKWARRKPALFVACAAAILSLAISGGAVAWFADYRQTEAVKIDSLIQKLRDNDTRRQEIESLRTIEEYPKNVMLAWLTWAKGKNGHELQTTLRSHAEKVREYDLAGFEWHYLKHLAFSAATELLPSHHGNVTSLAISPDSHFLMSYALDHKAQLWNLKLDQAPKVVSLNDGAEKKDFQFSPDSREVAILESRDKVSTIDRWDVPSGTRLDHWEFDGRVDGIQFAPDRSGLYFTLRRDTGHQICFRRFGSGTASFVDRFLLPEDSLISIQDFQTIRGGSQLLVASVEADGHLPLSLRLVDVETGKLWSESFVIGTSASPPLRADFSLTVSTDETKAAISFQSGQIHWRSLETKSMPLSFVFPQRRVHSTNFSSDGKTLGVGTSDSNGPGARITLLDVETGKQTDELELSRINTWSLTATPDWNTVYQGGASNIYVNHRKQTATQSSEKIILP
jgi:serine/threonine protein kinase